MCTVTVDIDEKALGELNPNLSGSAAIREWAQQLIDCRIQELMKNKDAFAKERDMSPEKLFGLVADNVNAIYADGDTETMGLEEARAMLHKTVREEYAQP